MVFGIVISAPESKRDYRILLENAPDVILMDIAMPVLNGTEATRIIWERHAQTRVVILSAYSDSVHVYRALQAGAMGYIAKRSVAKEVINAIREAHRGGTILAEN
jgi:two-component system, NarL family, response regulator DegU